MAAIVYTFPGWTTETLEEELAAVQLEIRARRRGRITQGSSSGQSWSIEGMPWAELWAYHNALAAALGHCVEQATMAVARPDFSGRGACW